MRAFFTFGKYHSLNDWNMMIIGYDVLMPEKRNRKVSIPFKNGMYDFGAKNYEEREIRVYCRFTNDTSEIPKHRLREIAYQLSQKKQLVFSDEPDKFYTGEVYDQTSLTRLANGQVADFELLFICEPFASSGTKEIPVNIGDNQIDYQGTAETRPTLIIKNIGTTNIADIYITSTIRRS